jgi:predicted nucleotidyltransferase
MNDRNIGLKSVQETIGRAIESGYKGSAFCYFYGSFAEGTNDEYSDVDLIIVYEKPIQPYREKFLFEGYLFDVFIYDAESLNGILNAARTTAQFTTVNAVLNSVTLPSETELSGQLREVAKRVKHVGYIFQNKAFRQQYITNILDDLKTSTKKNERHMLCVDLYRSMVDLILMMSGAGSHSRKHAARELTEYDPEFHARLDAAFIQALTDDITPLTDIADEVLKPLGGALREGFRMNYSDITRIPLPVL